MLREPVGGQPSDGVERARLGEKVVGAVDGQELVRTANPSPRESGHDGVLSRERQQTIGQLPARIATIQKPHARSLVPSFRRSIRSYPHCTREFPRSGLSRGRTRGRERDRPGCIAFTLMPGEAQTWPPRRADGVPAKEGAEGSSFDIVSHYFDTAAGRLRVPDGLRRATRVPVQLRGTRQAAVRRARAWPGAAARADHERLQRAGIQAPDAHATTTRVLPRINAAAPSAWERASPATPRRRRRGHPAQSRRAVRDPPPRA